jgi:hypothetical protein
VTKLRAEVMGRMREMTALDAPVVPCLPGLWMWAKALEAKQGFYSANKQGFISGESNKQGFYSANKQGFISANRINRDFIRRIMKRNRFYSRLIAKRNPGASRK